MHHLDLGGLARLSDEGLLKLSVRASHLRDLDLRGCTRLTEDGLARALAGCTLSGVPCAASLSMPHLRALTVCSLPAASDEVVRLIGQARPKLNLMR
mmetsp:Transcript_68082/g.134953  ORF Transcript_68082/g.134953 Transcript_68082/m.134953 type:complete len:97 (-) Transcript_68082:114-404(-)